MPEKHSLTPGDVPKSLSRHLPSERMFSVIVWAFVFSTVGYLVSHDDFRTQGFLDVFHILLPAIAIVAIHTYDYVQNTRATNKGPRIAKRLLAVPLLTLGINWICIFSLTEYRSHFRIILVPLGCVFTILGLLLVHSKSDARPST